MGTRFTIGGAEVGVGSAEYSHQEWAAGEQRREQLAEVRRSIELKQRLDAARSGPNAGEIALLEHRMKLAELRMRSVADFGITAGRTMTPGEGAVFDEAMIEAAHLKRQIERLLG